MVSRFFLLLSFVVAGLLWSGCTSSHETLQSRLQAIGKSDLQDILNDLPASAKGAVLAKPYFVVEGYQEFHGDTSIVYQANATLLFFYLDPSLDLCQLRKYRFKTSQAFWDRWDVKLIHIPPKYHGTGHP